MSVCAFSSANTPRVVFFYEDSNSVFFQYGGSCSIKFDSNGVSFYDIARGKPVFANH